MNFKAGETIKVNGKNFVITKTETFQYHTELLGTLQGDPSFLAGKRTIVADHLKANKTGYIYDWNAK